MTYKHNKVWRLRNVAKRNAQRKRYYNKHPNLLAEYKRWSVLDADLILMSKGTDRALHIVLGRSIQAIQSKRYALNKEARIC